MQTLQTSSLAGFKLSLQDVLAVISSVSVGAAFCFIINYYPVFFTFRFNAIALLPAMMIIINCVLLYLLSRRSNDYEARAWLGVTSGGFILLGLGEMCVRLSTSVSQRLFWYEIALFGLALVPVGFSTFVLLYTSFKKGKENVLLLGLLLTSAGLLAALSLNSVYQHLLLQSAVHNQLDLQLSTPFLVFLLYVFGLIGASTVKLLMHTRSAPAQSQRDLVRIIATGSSLALLGVATYLVGIWESNQLVSSASTLLQSALSVGVVYALHHYRNLSVSFAAVAPNVFDALHEMVIVTDPEFNIQVINEYTHERAGFLQAEVRTRPLAKLFEATAFTVLLANLKTQLESSKTAMFSDANIISNTGIAIPVNVSVATLTGAVPGYVFVCTDIAELKKIYGTAQTRNVELEALNDKFINQQRAMLNLLEDSRDLSEQLQQQKADVEKIVAQRTVELKAEHARLDASINSLDVGFIILDRDKKPLTTNAAYRTLLASDGESTKPDFKHLKALLADSFDIEQAIEESLRSGKNVTRGDLTINDKDVSLFIAPIFDDSTEHATVGVVMLLENVSEQKMLQRTRDEFFSIASHELRTPLTAIRGNTSMILDFYAEQLTDPALHEMVDDIFDSSTRLITIVNDFLDVSRLEQNKIVFSLTDFDAVDLVREVAREFEAGKISPDLYLHIDTAESSALTVHADRDRLKQAIINLIGNGFKFTESGGVTIRLTQVDAAFRIQVSDTGKGIPEESQNLLFRKFQQASNNILTRDSTRSTGLGLYISRLIMEGMSGKIYLDSSKVGEGSTFVIEVPTK